MRRWWQGLSKTERRAVVIVAPIVGLALIIAALRGRQRAAEDQAATDKQTGEQITETLPGGIIPGGYPPSAGGQPGDAIGLDQLAAFETSWTSSLGSVFGLIDQLAAQVEGLTVVANSPAADPDDPPVVTTAPTASAPSTSSTPKAIDGWDYVSDNLGYLWVVNWTGKQRYRVQARDESRARSIFGAPLTRGNQTPAWYNQEQIKFWGLHAKNGGWGDLAGRISLHGGMGWQDGGNWTGQGTR